MTSDNDLDDGILRQFAREFESLNDGKSEGKHFPYHREKVEIISTNHREKSGNIVGRIPLVGE